MKVGQILIHTSVKLVTINAGAYAGRDKILIHTSVKLVTGVVVKEPFVELILIHTSVKLVTPSLFACNRLL